MAPVPGDSPKTPAWHIDAVRGPSTPSLDHLVGAGKHRCRHFEAERPGGLEIEHSFVLGRRLNRQVGRLLALEDTIDVACRAAELVHEIIRNQAELSCSRRPSSRELRSATNPPSAVRQTYL